MGNISPYFFKDTAVSLNDAYTDALNQVVAVYPQYATYNEVPQNKIEYENAIQHLAGLEPWYGLFKWLLLVCMQYADHNMKQMDSSTTLVATDIAKLEHELHGISGQVHAADGALNDSHLLYNQQLLANLILCGLIVGVCFLYYKNDAPIYSDIRKSLPLFLALCLFTAFITWTVLRKIWTKRL